MIELKRNQLLFSFPQVHPQAILAIAFQRTLRIPDDGRDYPLPPGLGAFPLAHVDDHAENAPASWIEHGGVMLPMYQAEAMWMNFRSVPSGDPWQPYPFAIKVAAGKQCAVTGKAWENGLRRAPQNYMVAPRQPWLDGFVVEKGIIRQFVAMPLGAGYSAEEQITGKAEHGGLQLAVYPMKREVFEQRFPLVDGKATRRKPRSVLFFACRAHSADMGLAPGGRMRQQIYDDPFDLDDWDLAHTSRCFVHLCNSLVWEAVTGSRPPHPPPTARQYSKAGLPWFEYYDERATAVDGSPVLAGLKSVAQLGQEEGDVPLPENEPAAPEKIVVLRRGLAKGQVREGAF